MDGRTRYARARETLKEFKGKVVHLDKIKKEIMKKMASDSRSVAKILMLMQDLDMIKEVKPFKFKVVNDD